MRWKRLLYYLVINVLVSACTVLAVLYAWERYRPQEQASGPAPVVFLPTATPGAAAPADPGEVGAEPTAAGPSDFVSYTVQAGDTLSTIAVEFDVPMDDIILVNQLENPDELEVGMILLIPLTEAALTPQAQEPTAVRATLPPPTLDPAAPTAEDFGEPELQIVAVVGAGDLASERVVIRQNGDAQVSLQGWQVAAPGGQVYTFPQLVLFKDGAVTLFTKAGANSVAELHWGLSAAVWASGDVVTLLNPSGDIVAAYQIP